MCMEVIKMIELKLNDKSPYVQYARLALSRLGYETDISNDVYDIALNTIIKDLKTKNGISLAEDTINTEIWNILLPYLIGYTTETITPATTFYNLSQKYDTSINAIKTANPSFNEYNLPVGQKLIIPFNFDVVPVNVPYTYKLSELVTNGLSARYPFILTETVGLSVMGNQIQSLNIGNGTKKVFYNASHHANEWITTPLLFKFIEDYSKAYVNNESLADIDVKRQFAGKRLSVIPLVNPDGVDLVNGAIPKDSEFFKEAVKISERYPNIEFPNGWKANIRGTDLNLNYPAGWENAKEIKYSQGYTTPAPRDFVGISPLSEPESTALYYYTLKNNFLLTLSYHTQGEIIYYKYLDYNPPRALEIGRSLSEVSGYDLEITPTASGYAGYKDWFIYYFNRPGYTVEAGMGTNPLPISQFDKIYTNNLPLLMTALDMI